MYTASLQGRGISWVRGVKSPGVGSVRDCERWVEGYESGAISERVRRRRRERVRKCAGRGRGREGEGDGEMGMVIGWCAFLLCLFLGCEGGRE